MTEPEFDFDEVFDDDYIWFYAARTDAAASEHEAAAQAEGERGPSSMPRSAWRATIL